MIEKPNEDYLYHDSRARLEYGLAERAEEDTVAQAHRDLANLHLARRGWFEFITKCSTRTTANGPVVISRTDKEA
jgi:hypothetical protein